MKVLDVENPEKPAHYQFSYTRKLTEEEIKAGEVTIKLDPYRIAEVLDIGGGAREQILKKAIRWTTKGDSERQVVREITQACNRRIEMLDEDNL